MILNDFRIFLPRFSSSQSETFHWLTKYHQEKFGEDVSLKLGRFGAKPGQVNRRYHMLEDFRHSDWEKMTIHGGMEKRMAFFKEAVESVFDHWYSEETVPPNEIIHVTCTGYVSPSGAQRLVSKKDWGRTTTVTHAYHMGCYAAIPALKLAMGSIALGAAHVDIAHTELCTLHFRPERSTAEQLVVHTLFADGLIRFKAFPQHSKGLEVIGLRDEIVPQSAEEMGWTLSDWGMEMQLSSRVPVNIKENILSFTKRLLAESGRSMEEVSFFAVHPGGPKIIDAIQEALDLNEKKIEISRKTLREYGNMSSATLPFMWKAFLEDRSVPDGALIVSLAFGPGLTLAGALLRKKA